MKHVMVDIETLSTKPNAHVLTMGLVLFDPLGKEEDDVSSHYVMPASLNRGRDIDFETVKWWAQQNENARGQAFLGTSDSAHDALVAIMDAVENTNDIWANDPDFDCVILRDFIDHNFKGFKWPFYKHRSLRTIKSLLNLPKPAMVGTAHNAVDDCKNQIQVVRTAYRLLAEKGIV